MRARAATNTDSDVAIRVSAIASLGAAVIHFAVVPTHQQSWLASGVFFASIAVVQLVWALMAWDHPSPAIVFVGVVANAGAAALWVVSRTVGAPFGPHAGAPEAVQAAGICALLLECYVVMGAGWVRYRGRRSQLVPGVASALVLLGAGAVVATAASVGVVSGVQHDHHAPVDAEAGPHHEGPVRVPPVSDAVLPLPASESSHPSDGHHHH